MQYFLAKTDPDTYSIVDFERDGETIWDGVHNRAAILAIRAMRPGDLVYVYHSQSDKAIVGIAEVTGEPYEDTSDTRYSWAVPLRFVRRTNPVTLADFKAEPTVADFQLVKNSRLSTMPIPDSVAAWIDSRA